MSGAAHPYPETEKVLENDYLIDSWQTDQGLPQGTVTSIVQSQDGYLWLGTFNGLVRFDGMQFRVINPVNSPGLSSGRIVQLYEDRSGALWIGSEEGHVVRFFQGKYTSFQPPNLGSTARLARQMCEDAAGRLWLLTFESSVSRLQGDSFTPVTAPGSSASDTFDFITVDKAGVPWASTRSRLCLLKNDGFETAWPAAVAGSELRGLTKAREGGVWAACADGNQLYLRRFTEEGVVAEAGPFPVPSRVIYSMLQDRQGRIWIGILGGGIYRCDPGGQFLEITTRNGLPSNFVRSLYEDREGNIWVGMQGGGLARLKPSLFRKYRKQDGLSADQVLSVTEGEPGELWVATNGEWLNRIKQGKVDRFGVERGLSSASVWAVMRDREETLWVGTWGGGLFRMRGQRFEPFSARDNPPALVRGSPLSPIVLALFEDSRGEIWLGQHSFGAITRVVEGRPISLNIPEAPSNFDVRAISEDGEGAIWLGTHGAGLYRYHQGEFSHFGSTNGLQSDFIWALHTDSQSNLWIGTYQGGLTCWHDGRMQTLTTTNGLPSDVICQILEDDQSNMWFGSYGGVFRVARSDLSCYLSGGQDRIETHTYTKADGLPSIECTGGFQPSACKTRDGRLCFPTVKGLAIVDPRTAAPNPVPPEVRIESVSVDGKRVWDSLSDGAGADRTKPSITIPPGRAHVEIRYTGLSFSAPEQVNFRVQLTGLDPQWREAGSQRSVDYSHLHPGTYHFQVTARNSTHVWSDTGAAIGITVEPEYWQTSWFRVLLFGGLAAMVGGVARLIERRGQARKLAILDRRHAVERERLRIAQDIHDDLGARLTEITLLSELVREESAVNGAALGDMQQISTKARDLTRSVDEIVWAVDPSNDTLESLVTYACGYAEEYLRIAGIRCRFDVPTNVPRLSFSADHRHHLFLAFKECLTNIARHSGATETSIRFTLLGDAFTWVVADNGRGMDPGTAMGTRRNGLGNMRKRLAQVGGRCEISSNPGQGTRVEFHAPIPEDTP